MPQLGKQTFFFVGATVGARFESNRATAVHVVSLGHSAAFEVGVHWRRQLPVDARLGAAAQNVSA